MNNDLALENQTNLQDRLPSIMICIVQDFQIPFDE